MTENAPVEFHEDRVPTDGIDEAVDELIELYGGETKVSTARERRFVLPLRRGVAVAGGVECTLSWTVNESDEALVTLHCNRDVDAPKIQRVALLVAGAVGALLFMMWPFFGKMSGQFGTLAWIGGALAIAVYLLTLKRSSGGLAADFLQRLVRRQRNTVTS
ncbi:MAG TPA: hypothetical protein VKH35_09180 [Thermoanaerobaculia bacterium]|jgi:hypothetical protein|nr:hypothetical protein [Thermoanaerobaculia bacterium]